MDSLPIDSASVPSNPSTIEGNRRTIPFRFSGQTGEYFRIWIVNIALTILTLGIFSAWAKVRNKRYFYGNTTLDNSSFDYLADPLVILRGRLIVVGIVLLYMALTNFMPLLDAGFILLYLLATPWIVVKAIQFNNRYTAFRNIRFNFTGSFKEAIVIYVVLPILMLLTLGLALPYMIKRMNEFYVGNSLFGSSQFDIDLSTWAIFRIYLFAFIIPLLGILAAIAIPAYHAYQEEAQMAQIPGTDDSSLAEDSAEFARTLEMLENTDGIDADTPNMNEDVDGRLSDMEDGATGPDMNNPDVDTSMTGNPPADTDIDTVATYIVFGLQILIYLVYLLIYAYIKTRTTNLVLNSTRLGGHQLQCNMRVRDVFFIYLTNVFAILFTLGLLIPWAKIRVARYRVAHTSMIVAGNIDDFIGQEQENVKATAGEFADVFDMDIGI